MRKRTSPWFYPPTTCLRRRCSATGLPFCARVEIVALDTPHNLKKHLGLGERVVVSYEGPVDIAALESMPGVLGIKAESGTGGDCDRQKRG